MPAEWQGRLSRVPYIPSLAYRLAMVADGSLDATFVKPNAHDWDIAAADLILREAGGALLDQKAPRTALCRRSDPATARWSPAAANCSPCSAGIIARAGRLNIAINGSKVGGFRLDLSQTHDM